MRNQQQIKELKDIIIPEIFFESRNSFYQILNISYEDPNSIIDITNFNDGFWGLKDYTSEDFQLLIILDSLTEGFIQRYKPNEIEELWGKLSSILTCRDLEKLRKLIDYEIYDNKTFNYNFSNASLIFKDTDFKVVEITKNNFNAITILRNDEFDRIQKLEIGIITKELNKNVA